MNSTYDKPIFTDDPPSSTSSNNPQTLPSYQEYDQNEPPKGKTFFSKIIIGLLTLATLGLGYYTFLLNKGKHATEAELSAQKEQVLNELKLLKNSYDQVVLENKEVQESLLEARNKIDKYIDSLQEAKVSISALVRFKNQAFALAKERDLLLKKNDSLLRVNKSIRKDLDSVSMKLNNTTAKADSLAQQTNKLRKVVEEGSALQINKLIAEAVKGSKNKTTERSRAADKIRICFTVVANKIAKAGERTFYVKVTDPTGITLGANDTQSVGDITVIFSSAPQFIYDNKSVDICDFIAKPSKNFEKGAYKITIYDDKLNEVGTTDLVLK